MRACYDLHRTRRALFGAIAATVIATSALAPSALAQDIPVAESLAAAAAGRAQLEAGEIKIAEERSEWLASCATGPLVVLRTCTVFSRMLVEDDIQRLAAIAITATVIGEEPSVRIASDWQFPTVARVQVDSLPPLEAKQCNANACTFVGAAAIQLIEELKTGATVLARYEARGGPFQGRLPLDSFAAKLAELVRP